MKKYLKSEYETFYLKHFPGQHDQESHGDRYASGESLPKVTLEHAFDEWFEFDSASAMKQASRGESLASYRGTDGEKLTDEKQKELQACATLLQKQAETSNSGKRMLYRGQAFENLDDLNKAYPTNKKITLDGLTACSPDKKIASIYHDPQFLGMDEGEGVRVLFEIENPNGVIGITRDEKSEVILPHGASYKTTRKFQDEQGVWHVTLWSTEKRKKKK